MATGILIPVAFFVSTTIAGNDLPAIDAFDKLLLYAN